MTTAKELVKRGDKLFERKASFDGLCQGLAEQFYPERAQFTVSHDWGEEFGTHLFDSRPVMARRDLGNAFSAMLRPRGQPWVAMDVSDDLLRDKPGVRDWLDTRTQILRHYLYMPASRFVRSTKEGDHDYATFGNAVISVEEHPSKNGLRFMTHHLKDCVWCEDMNGQPDTLFRKMQMSARQMRQFFKSKGDSLHRNVTEALDKDPDKTFTVWHVMMPAVDYEWSGRKPRLKGAEWVSIYCDKSNEHLIREAPSFEFRYVVPRWQTISGSPYAVSPAAMTALADARTLQAMARIMLEAGEKAVDPPMKVTEEAVRGEINLHGGGLTWVDREYDERLGPSIEPLVNPGNVGLGLDMLMRLQMSMQDAWYLSKLNLPQQGEKTAFETAQLVEQFIRESIPLFEPLETEYNAPLLDMASAILLRLGAFGTEAQIPQALRGRDLVFSFQNPLQDAIKRGRYQQFQASMQAYAMGRELDPATVHDVDVREAMRDAVEATGAPSEWVRDREQADALADAEREQMAMRQAAAEAGQAGQVAQQIGQGAEAMAKGFMPGGAQ